MPQVGLHEDSKSDFPGPDRNENFIEIVDGEPVIYFVLGPDGSEKSGLKEFN